MSKQNIPGIYSYCDRWCERCTFTSRCAVYENENDIPPEELDMRNKAFWDRLGKNFAQAEMLLQKAAEERGLDLSATDEKDEAFEKTRERINIESRAHPLSKLSLTYAGLSREWLKTQPGMLDRLDSLKNELILGVESREGAKHQTETIKDSLAVIQWYGPFIHVKLMRALMGRMNYNERQADDDEFQHDFDGSAKIAMIAIDRSTQAWMSLFAMLPEKEDDFLSILALLEKIKKIAKDEFPKAEVFVRPGFDER